MDIILRKKRWTKRRILTGAGIAALVALIGGSYYFTSGKTVLNVQTERLSVATVTKGSFRETIVQNGIVQPMRSIYLDATEGGKVETRYVDEGVILKKGDPIVRLSNKALELSLVTQQTNVYDLLTQIQISRIAAEQNTSSKLNNLTDVESALSDAERVYLLDKHLFEKKVIGSQEYKKAEHDYFYYLKKKKINDQIMKQDSTSNIRQLQQISQSYQGSQKALDLLKERVGDLIVRAPVEGLLTSLDAEVGQTKKEGDRFGQIDVMGSFKVSLNDVDDHYSPRIFTGLTGTCSFRDTIYDMKITKVFTQITNGHFQVDMQFVGRAPKGLRRGQSLQVVVALSDETTAILVPRGGFYQQTGGNWIFKVSADGKKAYKVNIQLGRYNPDYYEVLQGLSPGDKVITSSYENYGNIEELALQN
ncbi:MAG: efflux transporter periplasmic adaptor subunit [Chitinophagaceae bacterium]|nr:efflux transporter periplasmic adaptor subunit [Chitinophagaceae bacterium]